MNNISRQNLIVLPPFIAETKNICENFIYMLSSPSDLTLIYRFDINHPSFFTAAIRSRIVKFILDRIRFSIDMSDSYAFGIDRLTSDEVYIAAYPLHDVSPHIMNFNHKLSMF